MTTKKDKSDIKNFKIIMVGNSMVGKSTFLVRYVDNTFNPQKATVGLDYRTKKVVKDGETFNLELWDSAGQERYRTIVFNYFKHSKAACVVFDITTPQSLEDARFWFKQLSIHCGDDIPKVLIGNKADLLNEIPGKDKEKHLEDVRPLIKAVEDEFNAKYFLASAMTGEGVKEVF